MRAIEDLWARLWHAGPPSLFQGLPDHRATARCEHWAIVDAVAAGNVEAAVAAMAEHRARTRVRAPRAGAVPATRGDEDGQRVPGAAPLHRRRAGESLRLGQVAGDLDMGPIPFPQASHERRR